MKVAIDLTTDEVKEMIAWYRVRQTMPDLADFAARGIERHNYGTSA